MALKIGLFSLKDGSGCTNLSIHIANYMAGSSDYTVAVVEKISGQRESEYKDISLKRDEDGTFVVNNVRFYPADIDIEANESVIIYDIGSVNAAYSFDEDYDKLYLCTDNDMDKITDILQFRAETGMQFDCVLFGASRDQVSVYAKNGIKGILIGNKKEERLDYNFYLILSQFMRVKALTPPEYHKDWEYAPVLFEGYVDPESIDDKRKRRDRRKVKEICQVEEEIVIPTESDLNTKISNEGLLSNIFSGFDFSDDIPSPEYMEEIASADKDDLINEFFGEDIPKEPDVEQDDENISLEEELVQIIEERNSHCTNEEEYVPSIEEREAELARREKLLNERYEYLSHREAMLADADSNTPQASMPRQASPRKIVTEFKPIPVDFNDESLLSKAIGIVNRDHKILCNLFLVTKAESLFIFSNMATFASKLSALKREIRNENNISYIILTYNDETRNPVILRNGKSREDVYMLLKNLDDNLRLNPYFTDEDIRTHRELTLFNEILFTS